MKSACMTQMAFNSVPSKSLFVYQQFLKKFMYEWGKKSLNIRAKGLAVILQRFILLYKCKKKVDFEAFYFHTPVCQYIAVKYVYRLGLGKMADTKLFSISDKLV